MSKLARFSFLAVYSIYARLILRVLCLAAGKSTFVRLLEQESADWEVVPEPIARWCNVQTQSDDFEVRMKE